MKTSIIIPAYNSERFIDQTISSIVAQSCVDWELVVVDDGSSNSTPEIVNQHVAKDSRIRLVTQANAGIAAARNLGFAESSQDFPFVLFFDHDDLWKSDALEILTQTLESELKAPAVYGISRFINGKGEPHLPGWLEEWHRDRRYVRDGRLITLPLDSPTNFDVEIFENKISTVGQVLIRRNVLKTLGLIFDPKMVPCDDWDLYLRLSQIGDLVFVPKLILDRRIHEKNVSSNDSVMKQSESYIRNAYALSKTLSERNKKLARESYRMWAREILQYRLQWAGECMRERRLLESAKQIRHAALLYAKVIGPLR